MTRCEISVLKSDTFWNTKVCQKSIWSPKLKRWPVKGGVAQVLWHSWSRVIWMGSVPTMTRMQQWGKILFLVFLIFLPSKEGVFFSVKNEEKILLLWLFQLRHSGKLAYWILDHVPSIYTCSEDCFTGVSDSWETISNNNQVHGPWGTWHKCCFLTIEFLFLL